MARDFIFTSESVTEGHPDKLCDRISDAIVDRFLRDDPYAPVVAECAVAKGILFIAARFADLGGIDLGKVARKTIKAVGYTRQTPFNAATCSIMTSLMPMSDRPLDYGALTDSDLERVPAHEQVSVFGFACDQTPELLPLPIVMANRIAAALAKARKDGRLPYLAPDGKVQVAIGYHDDRPARIHAISLIAATAEEWQGDERDLAERLRREVLDPVFENQSVRPDRNSQILVNPGGPFSIGGPTVHSGMTGRKTAVDTYGEYARFSASALSGKGPGRIDRVGAYAARHAAKNVVAAGLASECEIQLCYVIGDAHPVSFDVRTFGTGRIPDSEIASRLRDCCDLRVAAVVRRYNLRARRDGDRRLYAPLAAYGHFGRAGLDLPWEATDLAARLA